MEWGTGMIADFNECMPPLTLREWLTGMALMGAANHVGNYDSVTNEARIAKHAVMMADAVIAELAVNRGSHES